MKATIESTDRIVMVETRPGDVPIQGRVWEGMTAGGSKFAAIIVRVTPLDSDAAEFERDLKETRPPSPQAIEAIPLRMIL